eukprot:scaffold46953_cov62-Phaeocystis_antarctica.AAC.2
MGSAASTSVAAAPTPSRGSPSCARGLRAALSPRSSAPPHCSARSLVRPRWHLFPPSHLARSLGGNQLCGINGDYRVGTYTPEGITKLCEGLEGSAIDSLECAAAP